MSGLFTRNRADRAGACRLRRGDRSGGEVVCHGPLALRQVGNIDLLPFFDLTYTENRGISLGHVAGDQYGNPLAAGG
jgi:signal peptidase II